MESKNSIEIKAQLDDVYKLAKTIYSFPELLPDIKQVRILKRSPDGNRLVCEWQGIVKEFKTVIKWVTEDVWDDVSHTYNFCVISGHYYTFSGQWTFTDRDGKTRFYSEIDVDCDLPSIGAPLKFLVLRKVNANIKHMLKAIKARVENPQTLGHEEPVPASR